MNLFKKKPFALRGGSWIIREGDYRWLSPHFILSPHSTQFVFELFHRRVVFSWWRQNQLTPEELEREEQNTWEYWQDWRSQQKIDKAFGLPRPDTGKLLEKFDEFVR